ncbi:lysyl-tRNA synthetase [Coniosporium apollinis CBS 100218]|uniref:Lysine--tRNA ligase n=1 Tax=Coniosporium apollinis (strain CBS 100218) TaxID=1168221 RepID=R7Z2I0_CONA1|nr:lysyl-tRNA synthetase [Coniosporium apollinis CBS 100218]EON68101.1 lysyl-tRNA synthetase [Coniosporium apollinis CBS 100218]
MADPNTAAGAMAADSLTPEEGLRNLVLDDVTGEQVTKTELKKRNKMREREAKKAEKAAAAPPKPQKKTAEPDEKELNPNQFFEMRTRDVVRYLEKPETNPFPHKFNVTIEVPDFVEKYKDLKPGEELKEVEVQVAGRVYTTRSSGKNLLFYVVKGKDNAKVQIMCQSQQAQGHLSFEQQHERLRRGDVIGVIGHPGRTNPKSGGGGEVSVFAREVQLLAPNFHLLPSDYYGFTDPEQRFRQRYLDFLMNEKPHEIIKTRAKIIRYVRNFLDDRDFLEVQTPMMSSVAGGATAKPFKTYHNALDRELYLRVAPELELKKLIVGGFNRVYEIGQQFRNEDIDLTHNPEFTTCEFYQAYADMYDLMTMTEELVSGMVKHITGSYKTTYHTQHGDTYDINWEAPWKRIEMMPALEEATGEKFPPSDQLHTDETNAFLKKVLEKVKVECPPPMTNARMLDKLVGEFIEETCINPTFIMEHPQMMSPLAKYHRSKPGLCERFEAFVCKKEIVNAYTELNNPLDQRMRFEEQARQKAAGDEEAMFMDEGFIRAMEHGLPPTGGFGCGIDRLVMFITDNYSIKEVLTFPMMKDVKGQEMPKAAELAGVQPMPEEGIPHK